MVKECLYFRFSVYVFGVFKISAERADILNSERGGPYSLLRVSRVELSNQLDEMLEIVDKNNVGYIITDDGKDDLVLCPARWFSCMHDNDFGKGKPEVTTG